MNHLVKKISLVALSATFLLSPLVSQANNEEHPLADGLLKDRRAAEAIDIKLIAKKTGWSIANTKRHLNNQKRFSKFQTQMREQFPTEFAGSVFAEKPGAKSHVYFRGVVPGAARSQAASEAMGIAFEGGRAFSAKELNQRSVDVAKHLSKSGVKSMGATIMPDGTIEVMIQGNAKAGLTLPEHLKKGTIVRYVDHEISTEEHTYGGARIHSAGGSCTTGFSVRHRTTGTRGITTAAHCTGMNHYHQPQTAISYSTFFQAQHLGWLGDVEWHTTPSHLVLAEYYASPNDRRQVNSIANSISVNDWFCVYSRMQGTRTCDQVYSTGVTSLSGLTLISNLVAMDDDNTVAGDSGGPWSYGTQAGGGHRGDQWIWFGTRNVWTPARLFDNSLNVDVMTQ